MKWILLLEFKRTSDTSEAYYSDMKTVAEKQPSPIFKGLNVLVGERRWEVKVLPLIAGQRSVREKEWLESPKTLGYQRRGKGSSIGWVANCCRNVKNYSTATVGKYSIPPLIRYMHLQGKGPSIRASRSP
jgi:hypothetical protein